jgi:hypothetical protein
MSEPIYSQPAEGGLRVELDESHNIVIVEPRLRDDVRITVTHIEGLVAALNVVRQMQARLDAEWRERAQILPPPPIPVPVDLTPQQRRVVDTPGVRYLGRDEKGRPVVEGLSGIPQQMRRWALARSGDPLDIRGTVTPPEHTDA